MFDQSFLARRSFAGVPVEMNRIAVGTSGHKPELLERIAAIGMPVDQSKRGIIASRIAEDSSQHSGGSLLRAATHG